MYVELGKVATLDGIHLSSNLGDLSGCSNHQLFCRTEDSTYIWQAMQENLFCSCKLKDWYKGKISNKHIVVESIQGAFTLTGKQLHPRFCYNYVLYETLEGLAISFKDLPPFLSNNVNNYTSQSDKNSYLKLQQKFYK